MSNPVDLSAFQGKSVIVTGGASDIGLAISARFAAAGAYVTIADFDTWAGRASARLLTSHGLAVTFVECNVIDYASCAAAFRHAVEFSPTKTIHVAVLMPAVTIELDRLVDLAYQFGKVREIKLDEVAPQKTKVEEAEGSAVPRAKKIKVEDVEGSAIPKAKRIKVEGSAGEGATLEDGEPPRPRHPGLEVNLLGVYHCAYLALWHLSVDRQPGAKTEDDGGVVESSSARGTKAIVLYCSTVNTEVPNFADPSRGSKEFSVRGIFSALTRVAPALGIRANCVAPYLVRQRLYANTLSYNAAAGLTPEKRRRGVIEKGAQYAVDEALHGDIWSLPPPPCHYIDMGGSDDGTWANEVFNEVALKRKAAGDANPDVGKKPAIGLKQEREERRR